MKNFNVLSLALFIVVSIGCTPNRKTVKNDRKTSVSAENQAFFITDTNLVEARSEGALSQQNPAILNSEPNVFGVISTNDLMEKSTTFVVDSFVVVSDDYLKNKVLWRAVRR